MHSLMLQVLLIRAIEMAEGSGLSAELDFSKVPVLPFLDTYLQQNCIPDNTFRNWNSWEKKVSGVEDLKSFQVLNDPQTSGGLLIAIAADKAQELETYYYSDAVPVLPFLCFTCSLYWFHENF
jgi:selenide,water dikinase